MNNQEEKLKEREKLKYCHLCIYRYRSGEGRIFVYANHKVDTFSKFESIEDYIKKYKKKIGDDVTDLYIINIISLKNK